MAWETTLLEKFAKVMEGMEGNVVEISDPKRKSGITKLKEAEEALIRSETKYRSLVETIGAGVATTDFEGKFTFVNQALGEMLGRSEEELLGRHFVDFLHPEDIGRIMAVFQSAGQNPGVKPHLEFRVLHKDGRVVHCYSSPTVLWSQGRIIGFNAIIQDITERKIAEEVGKQAEDALRESEEKLRFLFEQLPIGVSLLDRNRKMIYANPALEKILAISRDDLFKGKYQNRRYIRPDGTPMPPEEYASVRAFQGQQPVHDVEIGVITESGKTIWTNVSAVPFPVADKGVVIATEDITERKRAEDMLVKSEKRFRQLSDLLPQIVFETDLNGNLTFANQSGIKLFGYTREDFESGVNIFALVVPEDHERIMKRFKEILSGSETAAREFRVRRKDGGIFPILMHAAAIFEDGVPRGVRGIGVDITERKRAEDEVRQKAKELQEKNDELTRFTAAVLHDLRSPLITIQTFQGYLEKDIRSQDEARIEKDLSYIRKSADKIGRLTDELLRLSRVGRVIHPFEEAPLRAIVEEALALVAGRIAGRGVRVELTEEPVVLWGDRTRFVEVFQNLVDNAVKFMGDQPAPRLEIGVEQDGEEIVLYVRDNGIGIDPQAQPMVFGLFQKLDPETEGMGIGLALVRRIVELHGGRIWVESEGPGKGATFRFTLAKTRRQLYHDTPEGGRNEREKRQTQRNSAD